MRSISTLALLVSPLISSTLAHYTLSQDYTGRAFYDGFEFFTDADPTKGHVKYVSKEIANNTGIAGLMTGGSAKDAIYLGMDTTNEAPQGRQSIRVQSSRAYNRGLIIADIAHMPGGVCGTWPALWLVGPNWPSSGEIDIIEGVNDETANKMAMHTGPGVVLAKNASFSGELVTTNCDINAAGQGKNVGCLIEDKDNSTYGKGFNEMGGGVFATELTATAITIWFFPRDAIPADITAGKPNVTTWSTPPRAAFTGDFKVEEHFKDLNIIFDTTFCGDWAGKVWANSGCAALAPTCEEYVTKNAAAFKESFWAINSLKVYEMMKHKVRRRGGGSVLSALSRFFKLHNSPLRGRMRV
jgi:Glycosyl hydrolases family 16